MASIADIQPNFQNPIMKALQAAGAVSNLKTQSQQRELAPKYFGMAQQNANTNQQNAATRQYLATVQKGLDQAKTGYYTGKTNLMGYTASPQITREQIANHLQKLGYPAFMVTRIISNPNLLNAISTHNMTYQEYMGGGPNTNLQPPQPITPPGSTLSSGDMSLPQQNNGNSNPYGLNTNTLMAGMEAYLKNKLINNGLNQAPQDAHPLIQKMNELSTNPSQYMVSPDLAQQQQQQTESDLIKQITPTAIMNQRQYEATLGNLYNTTSQFANSMSKYAGFKGTMGKLGDTLYSSGGKTVSPDYTNFLKFKQNMVLMRNELRRALGGQATDKEQALLNKVTDDNLTKMNPSQALALYKNLGNLINTVGSSLKENPAQIYNNLGNEADTSGLQANFIKGSGQGSKPITIPNFQNKEEFQKWYAGQSADVKAKVKSQLGEG